MRHELFLLLFDFNNFVSVFQSSANFIFIVVFYKINQRFQHSLVPKLFALHWSLSNLAKKSNKENFASKVKDWNFCFGQRTFLDLSLISKQNTLIACTGYFLFGQ